MTTETEIVQINPASEAETATIPVDMPGAETSIVVHGTTETDPDAESWQLFQAKIAGFFENATKYTTAFFERNRTLLSRIGWILLVLLGMRLLFGAIDALDDLPLVSPLLKLIGFVSVVRFVWRYLIWERDRQELSQQINRVKSEVFGAQV